MKYIGLFILLLIITCCENKPDIPGYNSEIVIDGYIENNQPAIVYLSFSAPYFSKIDSASLRKLLITTAKVSIETDGKTEILTLRRSGQQYPPFRYETDHLRGKPGKEYKLIVNFKGKDYTATTDIPNPIPVDSYNLPLINQNEEKKKSVLKISFSDPENEKNYYRIYTKRLHRDSIFIPAYISNLDDKFFNGKQIDFEVYQGSPSPLIKDPLYYFSPSDSIVLKFCSINKTTFDFWNSANEELYNAGNPLAASYSSIKSNISGGLGIWAGYGTYYSYIIQKKEANFKE